MSFYGKTGEEYFAAITEIHSLSREELGRRINDESPVDPGIALEVAILQLGGVETYESCEATEGHCYDRPTVRFLGGQAEGWHALGVALNHGLPVRELNRVWSITDGEPTGPNWELTFRRPDLARGLNDAESAPTPPSPDPRP